MSGAGETEPTRRRLEGRLGELRAELDRGRRMLAELEARGELLRDSVTRIAGAVQVLEEMVGEGIERRTTDAGGGDPAWDLGEPAERRSLP